MSRTFVQQLDLEIEIDVLTTGALAEIVNQILEFLLYQRNQIEFVYRTFRGFVNEWVIGASKAISKTSISSYMMEREREKAVKTKESISAMRELITNAFENHLVRRLRFIFGATTFTAKEAYTIHVPVEAASTVHLYDRHPLPKMLVNQLLLTLLTEQDLYGVFSKNLCPTNLYLELETLENEASISTSSNSSRLYPKQISKLPSSCKDIHFHLRHKLPVNFEQKVINCCKEIVVFEELLHMEKSFDEGNCAKTSSEDDFVTNWWEADVVVRGFKEKLIKGNSIWTK